MSCLRLIVLVVVCLAQACAIQVPSAPAGQGLTFLHLNDTYRVGAVEEGRSGGFGRVTTLVNGLRAEGRDVRLLHAGDFLFPSLESQIWDGAQMIDAMNFLANLAPMYVVPGNHEFDPRDAGDIVPRIRESRFEWLGDNLRLATGAADVDERLRRAFIIRSGDHRIGVFALTATPDDGGNQRTYTPFVDGSYVDIAESVIRSLESQGVDMIFGLTHLYIQDDIAIAKLKARHPAFLFIAGGHEHEPEYRPASADSALIVKGASNARVVWQIDVTFGPEGPSVTERRIRVDESVAVDAVYQATIEDRYRSELLRRMPFLTARIGEAAVPLDGREVGVRNGDSNWGMFIADQMREAFGDEPADMAFVHGGTLRIDDYIAEDITFEDVARTFGFPSLLRRVEMRGSDFRTLLEAGYRGIGPSKGYFPQISGFRVCVDRSRPDGQRIVQMQLPAAGGWEEIDAERIYTIVVPDFLYGNRDGYRFDAAMNPSPAGSELKYLVLDAIMEAESAGEAIGAPLDDGTLRTAFAANRGERCFD